MVSRNAPDILKTLSRWAYVPSAILFFLPLTCLAGAELGMSVGSTNDQIIIVQDPQATRNLLPRADRIQAMVNRAIIELKGLSDATQAWQTIADSNDVVAIKVFSSPGPNTGTRISVVEAVAKGLIDSGVPATNIIVWDRSVVDLRRAGYGALSRQLGIRLAGALESGYDESNYYSFALITGLRYGDLEFGKSGEGVGRNSYVTKLLGDKVTKIISIAPASNKLSTGVTGHLYSMTLSSVDNAWRFESNPSTLSWAMPEIYAMRSIGDRVVLCITDALICQYEGEDTTLLHYSAVANELYVGTDPVALDLLALRLLEKERDLSSSAQVKPDMNMYRNAALLQLGVDDLERVSIKRIVLNGRDTNSQPADATLSPTNQP